MLIRSQAGNQNRTRVFKAASSSASHLLHLKRHRVGNNLMKSPKRAPHKLPNPTASTRNYCYQANPNTHSQATKDAEGCAPFNATNFQHRLEAGPKKNGVGPASSFIVLCDGSFRDEHKTNGVHIRLAILVIMPDFHLDDGRGLSAACCLRYSFTLHPSLSPSLANCVCPGNLATA